MFEIEEPVEFQSASNEALPEYASVEKEDEGENLTVHDSKTSVGQ